MLLGVLRLIRVWLYHRVDIWGVLVHVDPIVLGVSWVWPENIFGPRLIVQHKFILVELIELSLI